MSIDRIAKRFNLQVPVPSAPVKRISGLNGAIPTVWDAGWQLYTDLSPAQIAAFQAMPQWTAFAASFNSWQRAPGLTAPPSVGAL